MRSDPYYFAIARRLEEEGDTPAAAAIYELLEEIERLREQIASLEAEALPLYFSEDQ